MTSTDPRDWLADQVVYQIFPDRFAVGGMTPAQKIASAPYANVVKKAWTDVPDKPPRGRDFFGGDLAGVHEKLDYIRSLGATCVYLTPIFRGHSNHKYDTLDWFEIDPMFGRMEDFDRLLAAAHSRGMRLVLDAVFNHISDLHPWHRKRHSHPKFSDYFLKIDGQEQYWRNYGQLPELDLTHPELEDYFYRRPQSVAQFWLARGVDGWRFDTATDLGLPFLMRMTSVLRPAYPDRVLWGEVTNFPGGEWTGPDRYDGVMNYYFRTSVVGFAGAALSAREAGDCHAELYEQMGRTAALRSLIILSSHDTPRLLDSLGNSDAKVKLALALQFSLPGIPMIYYGEENGMVGGEDPDNRRPMVWDMAKWNHGIRDRLVKLAGLRRDRPELRRGGFRDLTDRTDGKVLAYMRVGEQPGEFTLVAANAAESPAQVRLVVPYAHLYDGIRMTDLLGHPKTFTALGGRVDVEVPARTALLLAPDNRCIPRYHFYKPRNRV